MTRKSNKKRLDNIARRNREIRDLYNLLRKTYNWQTVYEFFEINYFIDRWAVDRAIRLSDSRPVVKDKASLQYKQAIDTDYKL